MKIAHIIFSMQMGGTETMLVDIMNEQAKSHSISLYIINNNYSDLVLKEIGKEVRIIKLNRRPGSRNPIPLIKFNLLLCSENPDIIHAHSPNISLILFPFVTNGRFAITYHSIGDSLIKMNRYRKIYGISYAVASDVSMRSGLPVKTILNGINCDVIKKSVFNSIGVFRMVQIGRLDIGIKGQDLSLKVIARLKGLGFCVTLDLIGEGNDYAYLNDLAQSLGILESVNFLGVKKRQFVYEHLCDYHLLVQPSRTEGFGLTIAEALAANVPVIVSDLEGPMEVIGNGKYGFFFQNEDCDDYLSKVIHVITNYKSAFDIASHGNIFVTSTFSVRNTAEMYLLNYS